MMVPAKPRRAVLRKAADSEIHPAEPRVSTTSVRARTGAVGTSVPPTAATPAPNRRSRKD